MTDYHPQNFEVDMILLLVSSIMWFGIATYHLFAREGLMKALSNKILLSHMMAQTTLIIWIIFKIAWL